MNKTGFYLLVLFSALTQAEDASKIDQITDIGQSRIEENVAIQVEIEKLADELLGIEAERKRIQSAAAGLEIYNSLLQQQINDQIEEMASLSDAINQVPIIEREISEQRIDATEANLRLLSQTWQQARENSKAIAPLAQAAEMSKSGELYIQLSRLYLDLSQWDQAIESIQKALHKEQRPEREDTAQILLGTALYHDQQFEASRAAFVHATLDARSEKIAGQWINHLDDKTRHKRTLRHVP